MTAKHNGAVLWIPKAHQQVGDGGLACTRGAHQGYGLTRLRFKPGTIQCLSITPLVLKVHAFDLDRHAAHRVWHRHTGAIGYRHRLIVHRIEPARRPQRIGQLAANV